MALFQEVPSEAVDHRTRDFTATVLGLVEDDLQLTVPRRVRWFDRVRKSDRASLVAAALKRGQMVETFAGPASLRGRCSPSLGDHLDVWVRRPAVGEPLEDVACTVAHELRHSHQVKVGGSLRHDSDRARLEADAARYASACLAALRDGSTDVDSFPGAVERRGTRTRSHGASSTGPGVIKYAAGLVQTVT